MAATLAALLACSALAPPSALAPLEGVRRDGRRFVLLSHGQTDGNAAGRIQGTSDFSRLTQRGVEQAAVAVDDLSRLLGGTSVNAVYLSPLTRAQRTLELVAQGWPVAVAAAARQVVLDDLKEVELREWAGLLSADVARDEPERLRMWRDEPAAFELNCGFRPIADPWERAAQVWRVLRADAATAATAAEPDGVTPFTTLIVAHSAINQALLCTAHGVGVADGFRAIAWPNCGAVEVVTEDGEASACWRWLGGGLAPGGEVHWRESIASRGERTDVFG